MTDHKASYFNRAKSWAVDEQASLRTMLSQTRFFAGGAVLIAVLEAFALMLLTPLKSVRPIPVLVDRQTGYVEVLREDGRRELRADTALTESLLAQYVIARESFDITDIAANYRKVALWSGDAARRDYLTTMPAANPNSPFRLYPRSTIVDARIKSISPIGPDVALVRFETRRQDQDGRATALHAWAAVVAYRFTDAPMSVDDRLVNPLGFQVVRYRRDAETLTPAEQPSNPSLAAAPDPLPEHMGRSPASIPPPASGVRP
jgi:type IV secretion system protein VirB8